MTGASLSDTDTDTKEKNQLDTHNELNTFDSNRELFIENFDSAAPITFQAIITTNNESDHNVIELFENSDIFSDFETNVLENDTNMDISSDTIFTDTTIEEIFNATFNPSSETLTIHEQEDNEENEESEESEEKKIQNCKTLDTLDSLNSNHPSSQNTIQTTQIHNPLDAFIPATSPISVPFDSSSIISFVPTMPIITLTQNNSSGNLTVDNSPTASTSPRDFFAATHKRTNSGKSNNTSIRDDSKDDEDSNDNQDGFILVTDVDTSAGSQDAQDLTSIINVTTSNSTQSISPIPQSSASSTYSVTSTTSATSTSSSTLSLHNAEPTPKYLPRPPVRQSSRTHAPIKISSHSIPKSTVGSAAHEVPITIYDENGFPIASQFTSTSTSASISTSHANRSMSSSGGGGGGNSISNSNYNSNHNSVGSTYDPIYPRSGSTQSLQSLSISSSSQVYDLQSQSQSMNGDTQSHLQPRQQEKQQQDDSFSAILSLNCDDASNSIDETVNIGHDMIRSHEVPQSTQSSMSFSMSLSISKQSESSGEFYYDSQHQHRQKHEQEQEQGRGHGLGQQDASYLGGGTNKKTFIAAKSRQSRTLSAAPDPDMPPRIQKLHNIDTTHATQGSGNVVESMEGVRGSIQGQTQGPGQSRMRPQTRTYNTINSGYVHTHSHSHNASLHRRQQQLDDDGDYIHHNHNYQDDNGNDNDNDNDNSDNDNDNDTSSHNLHNNVTRKRSSSRDGHHRYTTTPPATTSALFPKSNHIVGTVTPTMTSMTVVNTTSPISTPIMLDNNMSTTPIQTTQTNTSTPASISKSLLSNNIQTTHNTHNTTHIYIPPLLQAMNSYHEKTLPTSLSTSKQNIITKTRTQTSYSCNESDMDHKDQHTSFITSVDTDECDIQSQGSSRSPASSRSSEIRLELNEKQGLAQNNNLLNVSTFIPSSTTSSVSPSPSPAPTPTHSQTNINITDTASISTSTTFNTSHISNISQFSNIANMSHISHLSNTSSPTSSSSTHTTSSSFSTTSTTSAISTSTSTATSSTSHLSNQNSLSIRRKAPTPASIITTITNHESRMDYVTNKSYTAYEIMVVSPPLRWSVWKRYSEFSELHHQLRNVPELKGSKLPRLPPGKTFGRMADEFVEQRRALLTVYWDELNRINDIFGSIPFLTFIGALRSDTTNNTRLRHINHRFLRIDSLLSMCAAGDVVLFRTQGVLQSLHRGILNTDYDHVGVIVRIPEFSNSISSLYIMEATTDGCLCYPLRKRLTAWNVSGAEIVYRHLNMSRTENRLRALGHFVAENDGKPYSITPGKLFRSRNTRGGSEKQADAFFCSELVAGALKSIGALGFSKSNSGYYPSHFAEEATNDGSLDFTKGCYLESEFLVEFRAPEIMFAMQIPENVTFTHPGTLQNKSGNHSNNHSYYNSSNNNQSNDGNVLHNNSNQEPLPSMYEVSAMQSELYLPTHIYEHDYEHEDEDGDDSEEEKDEEDDDDEDGDGDDEQEEDHEYDTKNNDNIDIDDIERTSYTPKRYVTRSRGSSLLAEIAAMTEVSGIDTVSVQKHDQDVEDKLRRGDELDEWGSDDETKNSSKNNSRSNIVTATGTSLKPNNKIKPVLPPKTRKKSITASASVAPGMTEPVAPANN